MSFRPERRETRSARATAGTARATVLAATATLSIALVAPATQAAAAAPEPARATTPSSVRSVTLVTGDVVHVTTGGDGRSSVSLEPRPDGSIPDAAINTVHGHTYVVPTVAYGLLAAHRLDRSLFDVTQLLDDEYDDASRDTLPVLVDYGSGTTAAKEAKAASLLSAERTVVVPALGIAAFRAEKRAARAFWADLTRGSDDEGNPTGLTDGASKVLLDGRVHLELDQSVPQIHAPEAWAKGFTGQGTTVAVLDTGWDPTHPDLPPSLAAATKNFTTDASVTDGNGHGTHVASTIAGTGAASGGSRKGVAPGTHLLIGKVLGDGGFGEDSWVLAGMQWAVEQHADIVSMSLGGDADDGTNPLAQAVNELSASSDTLFVIAAGNAGSAPSTVTAPGSADAALTVGAVDGDDRMADFSGRGPRLRDGALKPEVVAPGVDITAARAAGTDLGGDLATDPWYTTISGTSMATPHVAGLAAILKGEHPSWDGEQLKDAIVDSTVPVSGASAFDAGTGRVDALQAVDQTVFATGVLELGNFAWPYSDLAPSSKQLTYRNSGDDPVTLDLALAGEDGTPDPSGAVSLSASTVTVPADGIASVDVTVDPTIGSPGAYADVVTATVEGGSETVRTGVAYQLEPERYDVTVTVKPRTGSLAVGHLVSLVGFQDPWIYEQRTFDPSTDAQTVTFRVPPGDYSTVAISNGQRTDGSREGVVDYEPSFSVGADTSVVLDENDTKRFSYHVDQPVVVDGAIMDVSWAGPSGFNDFIYYGVVDRLYARPSADLPGTTQASNQWLLNQPEGTATTAAGAQLALRPVAPPDDLASNVAVPHLKGSYRVADAGSVEALQTEHVSGKVAVVASTCSDLSGTVSTLADAGALAVVSYAEAGSQCAGSLAEAGAVPALQTAPAQARLLLAAAGKPVDFVTHRTPAYVYNLVRFYADQVPAGGVVEGTGKAVAAVRETYRGMDSTSADGVVALEEATAWIPARDGSANLISRRVALPSTVTYHLSTGAEWERSVRVQDSTYYGEYALLWAPRRTFAGGTTSKDTWFGGPLASRVSPFSDAESFPPPYRQLCTDPDVCAEPRDELFVNNLGAVTDAAGHMGHSDIFSNEYSGQIYVDGTQQLDMFASVFMNVQIPLGRHRVRIVADVQRDNPFWQLSKHVRTTWRFTSSEPAPDRPSFLPMLGVDYRMALSSTNQAPAGGYDFSIGFAMPVGVRTAPVTDPSVEVSWNGGSTWRTLPVRCAANSCQVHVTNRTGALASLRVRATDTQGRSVTQTVIDAYRVR